MKRIKDTWKDVIDIDNGIFAIIEGTRYKRGNDETKRLLADGTHEIDREKAKAYAEDIIAELKSNTWQHEKPRYRRQFCRNKTRRKGKWRDLYIPSLKDHTVAHMVMQANMEAFTRGMHPHSCGSVPGRGTKHIVRTVSRWCQKDKECRYFVKLDIRKFFDNIDKDILMGKLRGKIKDKDSLRVFEQIIESAPVACPVGYYTSPWLANLYLEDLDWHIVQKLFKERRGKRINYVRHYIRYMDDMLLIGTSKSDLRKAIHAIKDLLAEIHLEVKPAWEIKSIGKMTDNGRLKAGTFWIDIGGYKFCKDCTILRDGIFLSTRRLAHKMAHGYVIHEARSMMSRVGWAKHCNSRNFLENEIKPYVNLKELRMVISNVDQKRKQRPCKAAGI